MKKSFKINFNIFAVLAIIIFCIAITPITFQNDTYYTIKIGELITNNGIDMKDHFSWHGNLDYTYPHWLYDLGTYHIYNIGQNIGVNSGIDNGGMYAIYIVTLLLTIILGLTIYNVNKKLSKNNLISFLLTIGAVYVIRDFIAARAQLVTFILFMLEIYFIEMFIRTKKKRYPIFLVIISLLIANLHVAVWPFFFILFMPYLVEYVLILIKDAYLIDRLIIKIKELRLEKFKKKKINEEKIKKLGEVIEANKATFEKIRFEKEEKRKNPYKLILEKSNGVKWLILVAIICILTGCITPIGDTPFTYLIKTMQGNTTENINEHLPLTLIQNTEFLMVLVIYLGILIFTKVKIRLKDLFLLGGLVLLTFITKRQVSLCAILTSIILNNMICSFLELNVKNYKEKIKKVEEDILIELIILVSTVAISINIFSPKANNDFIDESQYPIEASEYIIENLDLTTIKLYNEYNYGSYLLYKGIPVFIDSRADLYSPEFNEGIDVFSDFLDISNIGLYYEEKFKEYNITHVMMYKNAKLNLFISRDENYTKLYEDEYFVIYERNIKE
ncbi:MAG: hypothetical protein IKT41_04280 [Clostridia bacterium]|nr:hypothetical protein [Clostridia bacterium]